jgi:hypothetical protein
VFGRCKGHYGIYTGLSARAEFGNFIDNNPDPKQEISMTQSVTQLHLFQPPRADQMSDSDRQSQHPARQPDIHKETWIHSQDHPAKRTAPFFEPETIPQIHLE